MSETTRSSQGLVETRSSAETVAAMIPFMLFATSRKGDTEVLSSVVDLLDEDLEHLRRQPVAIDRIYFAHPKKKDTVAIYRLDDEDVILGRFEGFTLTEEGEPRIAAKILVNLVPESDLGPFREETLPLWIPEQETLRWLNFKYTPRPKRRPWIPFLKMS